MAIATPTPATSVPQGTNSPVYSGANIVGYTKQGAPGVVQNATQGSNTTNTGANYTPTGGATLNANINTPTSTATAPAPAVVTSTKANNDLTNKQTQTNQINTDAQNQALAKSQAAYQAVSTAPDQTPNQKTTTQSPEDALNAKIDALTSSLGEGEKSITDDENKKLAPLQDEQQKTQQELDSQAGTAFSQLRSIANGTYPLSPAEQSVLSSTATIYQQTIQAQVQANAAYTGQMTEAMASLGISTSAPTQAMGLIHATIDEGSQKLATLDAQMAKSIGDLTLAFQKQDYTMVSDSWDKTSKYLTDRMSTLQGMQKSIMDYAQQQKQDLKDQTVTSLQAIMDSNTISFQAKNQMIEEAKLDETTRHDLAQENIAKFTAGMMHPTGNGTSLPSVTTGANGKPDPVSQATFLAQFPPDVASLIKGIAGYTINPTSLTTSKKQAMGGFTQAQILALASQYNPNFDEKSYQTRAAMQRNVASGQYSQAITAANTAMQHVQELVNNFSALGNGSVVPGFFNAGKNFVGSAIMGGSAPNNFNITADALATELSKFYKGVGAPSEAEITNWRSSLSPNMSPDQFNGAVTTLMNLLGGKMATLTDNYSSVMGEPGNFQILTDRNAQALNKMGIDPSTIDPTYGNSPTVKLQNFYTTDPKNSSLIDQLIQADPSLKTDPQKMIDTLEANGIML